MVHLPNGDSLEYLAYPQFLNKRYASIMNTNGYS